MLDIIGRKWLYFLISGFLIIPGIISLVLWGIKPGIDFTGGALLEIQDSSRPGRDQIQNFMDEVKKITKSQNVEISSIQRSGEDSYLLRLKPIDKDQNQKLQEELKKQFREMKELRFETIGPSIGRETTEKAIKSILVASLIIILYIAWAFREIPAPYKSWKFGVCAVAALIHDVLVVVGFFSLLGHFFSIEVDSLFITALLTVMGFSVHDTIVVFDRIRENLHKLPSQLSFSHVVNESIVQTLARSLSTSLTVLFTLLALLLFGGESIRWFIVALLVGITSGTYSSIFNAAPLLVLWEEVSQCK